ncbi:MAG: histidine--tRNA ligase, partial [Oscillospiraceae bacterium]|nr:histidine--tRNA ligase [Oscillospiraceae bacterium]
FEKNPMRILDCKSDICKGIAADAPVITDYLCAECAEHFSAVRRLLESEGIEYSIDPKIVRGLDYYTRTVFEFISRDIGAQATVCGGGRYDGLIDEMGGPATPALGFAMGMERLILAMKTKGTAFTDDVCDLYILAADDDTTGGKALETAVRIAAKAREAGKWAEYDLCGRSFKAQMKYANKIGARHLAVIGASELESGTAEVKNMETGEKTTVKLDDISTVC